MRNAVAVVEHRKGQTRKVTYELATQARELADTLGGKAHAVVLGQGSAALAENLARYPLDVVHVAEDEDVDAFLLDPAIDYLEAALRSIGGSVVLVPNTMYGRDVASRLSARLEAGLVADVTGFEVREGRVACVAPKLGGVTITTCAFKDCEYGVATVRPNAFEARESGSGARIEQLSKPALKNRMRVANEVEEASGELGLEEAPVVVSGGRGLGGPDAFATLLKPLADALGGAVGASRAAADAGWVPYSLQIGQTGKTVSPKLYIAAGISGAIQHKVGMRSAGTIVAINKDGTAPIAEFSDLVVVGDAFEILPALTKLVESAKA